MDNLQNLETWLTLALKINPGMKFIRLHGIDAAGQCTCGEIHEDEYDLLRVNSELDDADFFEITDRTKSASLSLISYECIGRLRLLAWGDFVVLVFRRTDTRHLSIGVMLRNLSQHGWKASDSLDSPEFLYRVLHRPADLVIASQIHVLLEELDLSVNALKLGFCEDLRAQEE